MHAESNTDTVSRMSLVLRIAARPTLLFVSSYMLLMTLHEVAHALAAYQLGFTSTVFHLWVTPESANATPAQVAMIAAAGPLFSLIAGIAGWSAYRRYPEAPSALMFLMLGIVGIYGFLGPLVGAALGGDVHTILRSMRVPAAVSHGVSIAGFVGLSTFMFCSGREFMGAAPRGAERIAAVFGTVIAPWLIGSAFAVLLYLPLPPNLIVPTLLGPAFWIFAAIGAAWSKVSPGPRQAIQSIRSPDVVLGALSLVIVRLLVNGIRFAPAFVLLSARHLAGPEQH